jgi:hypothetical protein
MVVHDLNIVGIARSPTKTDPPLFVDADAVLAFAIPSQPLQPVPRRNPEVFENCGRVEHPELAECRPLDIGPQLLDWVSLEKALGVSIPEALDHRE